jgi:hypothetical protein
MQRPDTIIEIHRERVQDQTADMFGGDRYTQSVDGTGYCATATLDLTLDRICFIFDSHQRLWQEETDGESHDPLRHFAIDLVIFDSKIVIDSVTCIPLVELPPATITIPDGPRAGQARDIAYNEIPLFGQLTIHYQLEPHQTEPGRQTIALNFGVQDAPVLVATSRVCPPPVRSAHRAPVRRGNRLHRTRPASVTLPSRRIQMCHNTMTFVVRSHRCVLDWCRNTSV